MRTLATACALVLAIAGCRQEEQHPAPPPQPAAPVVVSPDLPADVPGGAPNADLRTASAYAWQEFIAMNWPAQRDARDTPDRQRRFGERGGALVWETFRSKVEIYPGNGSATVGPHGWNSGAPDYGYDAAPVYTYAGDVPPCDSASKDTAFVNLDEISEIGFASMHAGVASGATIRYLAKANRDHYRYVVANQFWYGFLTPGTPAAIAAGNFTKAVTKTPFVIPPGAPI